MKTTKIQWTDHTFNGWIGCTKVSEGCEHCYAEQMAKRFSANITQGKNLWQKGVPRYLTVNNNWKKTLLWNRKAIKTGVRSKVFCMSMADIFDANVPRAWRKRLWDLIAECDSLDWQLLTKRPQNILRMLPHNWNSGWSHVWIGTSVENQENADKRLPLLKAVPASVRFLSIEPLLGPVNLDLRGIHWVICGGESGPKFREMDLDWARSVRDQCIAQGVPFFFKQRSGRFTSQLDRKLDGQYWEEMPGH